MAISGKSTIENPLIIRYVVDTWSALGKGSFIKCSNKTNNALVINSIYNSDVPNQLGGYLKIDVIINTARHVNLIVKTQAVKEDCQVTAFDSENR